MSEKPNVWTGDHTLSVRRRVEHYRGMAMIGAIAIIAAMIACLVAGGFIWSRLAGP